MEGLPIAYLQEWGRRLHLILPTSNSSGAMLQASMPSFEHSRLWTMFRSPVKGASAW
jgi:hypothetical protein